MTDPILIAVDAGGTSVKVVAYDLTGTEIAQRAAVVQTQHHPDGRVERDPAAFWQGTAQALRALVTACKGREILGVGCTGFGNGIFLVDDLGHATRPGIVSVDHRAQPLVDALTAAGDAGDIMRVIGHRLWGGMTLMQLAHLAQQEPETMARTRWALACKDYIRFQLTGVALTDPTDASGGGLIDQVSGTYATDVFAQLGIRDMSDRFPEMVPSDAVGGHISAKAAQATGIPEGTPVAGSMMDVAACALGAGAFDAPVLTMIAGTWSINSLETDQPCVGEMPLLNMLYNKPGTRLVAEGSPSSAANLGWFLDSALAGQLSISEANALVTKTPVQHRRCHFLPYVFGPAPRRGSFVDLAATDNQGTMLRAIFEGVAFQHLRHANDVARKVGTDVPLTIRLAGGAAKSPVWAQIFADITQRRVEAVSATEVGALGAAICTAVACGAYPDLSQAVAAMTQVTSHYEPTPEHRAFYSKRYEEFQRLDTGLSQLLKDCPN